MSDIPLSGFELLTDIACFFIMGGLSYDIMDQTCSDTIIDICPVLRLCTVLGYFGSFGILLAIIQNIVTRKKTESAGEGKKETNYVVGKADNEIKKPSLDTV